MTSKTTEAILVTGGAGFIGAHTCKALAQAGMVPVTLDNLVNGHRSAVKWGPLAVGDINDHACLARVMRQYQPTAVIHFAAFASVGESMTDPGKYYRNNMAGSLGLLEAMRDFGVKDLVFSSTAAVYGIPSRSPIPEDHPLNPINPYGWSKLMMERMMRDFAAAHGLRFIALRYFNAAGGDPSGEIGERHDPETHLIPLVLDAAMGRRANVTIFGHDYPTLDGSCIRDYIHVSDLADAHLRALQYLRAGGKEQAFNLGTGQGYSVKEVVAAVQRITNKKVPAVIGARREGDPPELVADPTRAKLILDWNPTHSSLDAIITHAWNFRRKT